MVTAELPPKADPIKIATKIIGEVDLLSTKIMHNPAVFGFFQLKVTQSSLRETKDGAYRIMRLMTQHSLGDTRMSREYFSDINTISHRQAADFARTWLRKAMAHVVLISPAQPRQSDALTLSVPARQTMLDDPKVATMGASPKALFPDGRFVWRKLANGVEVAVLGRPRSAINTLLLGVRSTSRVPDLEPIDTFVETARHTPPCPGSAMGCSDDVDATSYRSIVSTLAENTPEAVRYLGMVAAAPRYEWSPGVKDWLGPLLEKREGMPDMLARRDLHSALWRDHPKGKRLTTALLQRITLSDLLRWEQANIRPENALVVAVTNQDPDELADTIGAQMRQWSVQRPPARIPAFPTPDLTRTRPLQILYATDPSLESARFNFGCLMPPLKTFSERAAAKMVGDWAYRVLFAQLRNQSDASYSTATQVSAYSSGETFMQGSMDVSMDQLGPAIGMFRDLFNSPREFGDGEIGHMKELRRRRVALQNVTGPEIAAEVFDRWTFHMGNPTPLREFDEIEKVSASELGTVWNVCRQDAVLQIRTNRSVRSGSVERLAN